VTAAVVGWGLLVVAIVSLLRAALLDRRLQHYRAPGTPAAAYLGPLGRWRRDLYTAEGHPLIWPTQQAFAVFCVASLIGALVLENAL
jgi:hypothetical protein